MKPKVLFLHGSRYEGEYKAGETGIVDGYCRGGDDVPYAVVIKEDNTFVLAPLQHLKVMYWEDRTQ